MNRQWPCGAAAPHLLLIAAGVGAALVLATIGGLVMRARASTDPARFVAADVVARVRGWWWMAAVGFAALLAGNVAIVVFFALLSFLSFREFITLTPTRRADHHALFWSFWVLLPLQYVLLCLNWYGMFAIFIPVWVFLFIAIRTTLSGDSKHYLERAAKIQWGLMLCVYCLSHLPALLTLPIAGYSEIAGYDVGRNAELVLWLILVVQGSDILQYCWGKAIGRHKMAPKLSPNKTWEGIVGGTLSASALGMALWWMTPFTPQYALAMAAGACMLGVAGGVVLSAIKRDAGIKDFGHLIPGHGGVLDRVDSLILAAPVMFHLTRYYWIDRAIVPF